MKINIYRFEDQHKGGFNGGEILENKPVQLSNDNKLQPYSNIFYWAHAWSDKGSLIAEHPHKAFEIMSFVLKGEVEHYDSRNREWVRLNAGDVQIIRAGSGISHAEKLGRDTEMFQIWFDPDVAKTIKLPASYNDYSAASFKVVKYNGMTEKIYCGNGSPVTMETSEIDIKEVSFGKGSHSYRLLTDRYCSVYLIEGKLEIETEIVNANDFLVIENEDALNFNVLEAGKIFLIESPLAMTYKTFAEQYKK